jgi:hypothetical protein
MRKAVLKLSESPIIPELKDDQSKAPHQDLIRISERRLSSEINFNYTNQSSQLDTPQDNLKKQTTLTRK